MLRILLLDCSDGLQDRLKDQGFDVEAGTVGFCTGVRTLPSQIYEKDVIVYNPESFPADGVLRETPRSSTPEYDLSYLGGRIQNGATFIAFLNRLSNSIEAQSMFYGWIPEMPRIEFTSDRSVSCNTFELYPQNKAEYLAPIVTPAELSSPVLLKLEWPKQQDYPRDVFPIFWNEHEHCLGVMILRGYGRYIFLPKYKSNEEAIQTFLHRVLPRLYDTTAKGRLSEIFQSPAERDAQTELAKLESIEAQLEKRKEAVRVQLASATREKLKVIGADPTAQQIIIYYDYAKRQDDAALYYLYKVVETIENKFGGESAAIKTVGSGTEWKAVKRLANESYRDARHAPKPGDVIKKWTDSELKKCFKDVEVIVTAYFGTLFAPIPKEGNP